MFVKKQGKYQFEDFEADLSRRTLQRGGQPVVLRARTFDLLAYFLLNARRNVSKSELLRALWGNAHDEESNLSQDIFLLRKALSGATPGEKIVANVPGKGYQFTPTVVKLPDARASFDPGPHATFAPRHLEPKSIPADEKSVQRDEEFADLELSAGTGERPTLHVLQPGPWQISGVIALIVVLCAGGWLAWRAKHKPGVETNAQALGLMIADVDNSTGYPEFDAIPAALAIDLGQSPFLRLAPASKVEAVRDQMEADAVKAGGTSATPSDPAHVLRSLCRSVGEQAYVAGDIHRLARKYMLTLRVTDCSSGKSLAESRGIADSPDSVVAILDKITIDLRKQLGESKDSIARFSKPLFAGRTPSLTAFYAYAGASVLSRQGKAADAIPLLQKATEIDPKFALAHADLGVLHANLGEHEQATVSLSKAYELRDSVDAEDRFFIIATYNALVTNDLQASIRNNKEWSEAYPNNPAPFGNLAVLQTEVGKAADALEPARRALSLDPNNRTSYEVLARAQMDLGQFEEAASTCRLAISRHLDGEQIHAFLLQIAFLRLDQPVIDEQLDWLTAAAPDSPMLSLQHGLMDFAEGKIRSGQALLSKAAEGYRKQGRAADANNILASLPRMLADLGLPDSARSALGRWPADAPSLASSALDHGEDIPVAWAALGETSRAQSMLTRELDAQPSATLWRESQAPQVRAAIALNQHQPEEAVKSLESAASYDLRSFRIPALRGRACLAAGQPELAEVEFHKILDHPGIEPFSPNYALARLGLARALVQQNKLVDAGFAYKIVLEIWKDADPDLPRLKEAKAEYARLSGEPKKAPAKPKKK